MARGGQRGVCTDHERVEDKRNVKWRVKVSLKEGGKVVTRLSHRGVRDACREATRLRQEWNALYEADELSPSATTGLDGGELGIRTCGHTQGLAGRACQVGSAQESSTLGEANATLAESVGEQEEWWQAMLAAMHSEDGEPHSFGRCMPVQMGACVNADADTVLMKRQRLEARLMGEEWKLRLVGRGEWKNVSGRVLVEFVAGCHRRLLHAGRDVLTATIKARYEIPGLTDIVQYVLDSCGTCPLVKVPQGLPNIERSIVSMCVNECLHIDTGDLGVAMDVPGQHIHGVRLIQARMDGYSGMTFVTPVKSAGSVEAMAALEGHILAIGRPAKVVTDNGPEFKDAFAIGCARWQIEHVHTAPGKSQSNGRIERVFRELWHGLRCVMVDFDIKPGQLMLFVQGVVNALNERRSADGSFSSFRMFYGREPISGEETTLNRLLYSRPRKDLGERHTYAVGEEVLFYHPRRTFGKGGSTGMKGVGRNENMVVVACLSELVYQLRPLKRIRVQDGTDGMSRTVLAHVASMTKTGMQSILTPTGSVSALKGMAKCVTGAVSSSKPHDVGSGIHPLPQQGGERQGSGGKSVSVAEARIIVPNAVCSVGGSVVTTSGETEQVAGTTSQGSGIHSPRHISSGQTTVDAERVQSRVTDKGSLMCGKTWDEWNEYVGNVVVYKKSYTHAKGVRQALDLGLVLRLDSERQEVCVHWLVTRTPGRQLLHKRLFTKFWRDEADTEKIVTGWEEPRVKGKKYLRYEMVVPLSDVLDVQPFSLTAEKGVPMWVVQQVAGGVNGFAFLTLGSEARMDDYGDMGGHQLQVNDESGWDAEWWKTWDEHETVPLSFNVSTGAFSLEPVECAQQRRDDKKVFENLSVDMGWQGLVEFDDVAKDGVFIDAAKGPKTDEAKAVSMFVQYGSHTLSQDLIETTDDDGFGPEVDYDDDVDKEWDENEEEMNANIGRNEEEGIEVESTEEDGVKEGDVDGLTKAERERGWMRRMTVRSLCFSRLCAGKRMRSRWQDSGVCYCVLGWVRNRRVIS